RPLLPALPCSSQAALVRQHQIVTMDHLIPAAITQNRFDVGGLAAGDRAALVGRIADDAAAELGAVASEHRDRIAALELALDVDDAGRQQAPPGRERALGAL